MYVSSSASKHRFIHSSQAYETVVILNTMDRVIVCFGYTYAVEWSNSIVTLVQYTSKIYKDRARPPMPYVFRVPESGASSRAQSGKDPVPP